MTPEQIENDYNTGYFTLGWGEMFRMTLFGDKKILWDFWTIDKMWHHGALVQKDEIEILYIDAIPRGVFPCRQRI